MGMHRGERKVSSADLRRGYRSVMWNKKLEGAYTVDEWIERLSFIAEKDTTVDSQVRWTFNIMIFGFIGFFVAVFTDLVAIAALLLVVVPIATIFFLIVRKMDVPNRIREVVLPLLVILREDAHPDAPLWLNVDLTKYDRADKQVGKAEVTVDTPARRVEQTRFYNGWFHGRLRLCDGSLLKLELADLVKRRNVRRVTRTPGRTSTKHKTKHKVKTRVNISLAVRNNRYRFNPSDAPGAPKLKQQSDRKSILQYRRDLSESRWFTEEVDLGEVCYSISLLYQSLTPLKKVKS